MSFREFLAEMPYLEVGDQITDIELEKIKTKDQFISYLKFFFSLNNTTLKDKYGERIQFKTKKERNLLKDAFFNNIDIMNFLPSIKMDQKELKSLLNKL